ncbi:MAG: hypothetical protein DSY55_05600 [Clostridia bacterium]|nr:MAG: hypothetical protein DSY55_05600 [Clostridia bacterium]
MTYLLEDAIIKRHILSLFLIAPMTSSRPRPFGVTLIAFFYLGLAILALIAAARYVLNPAGDQQLILLFDRLEIPVTFLNLLAVPPLITAGLATAMFRGLWQQREWGRVAAIFFQFIGMLLALTLMAFLFVFNLASSRYMLMAVGLFVLFAATFIYLLKAMREAPPLAEAEALPAPPPPVQSASPVIDERGDLPYRPARPYAEPPAPDFVSSAPPAPPMFPPPAAAPAPRPDLYESVHHATTVVLADKKNATLQLPAEEAPRSAPLACLTALSGSKQGRRFQLFARDYLIGRHPDMADIHIDDPTVSAQHARLRYENDEFVLYDLDSTNGTFVNGDPIKSRILRTRKYIKLGETELLFTPDCEES